MPFNSEELSRVVSRFQHTKAEVDFRPANATELGHLESLKLKGELLAFYTHFSPHDRFDSKIRRERVYLGGLEFCTVEGLLNPVSTCEHKAREVGMIAFGSDDSGNDYCWERPTSGERFAGAVYKLDHEVIGDDSPQSEVMAGATKLSDSFQSFLADLVEGQIYLDKTYDTWGRE